MAAAPPLSKAEYLKRYLSRADAGADGGPESCRKRRRKRPKPGGAGGQGMRIVDDDVSWTCISTTKPEKEEEDDGDLPVVAEFVDERPEDIKQMEAFRSSAKWKLLGSHGEDLSSPRHLRHDTPDFSPPRRARHDTPDPSPPRRARHDTPDSSPPSHFGSKQPDSKGSSPSHRTFHISSSPRRCQSHTMDSSYPSGSWKVSDSDLSPPRNRPRPQTSDSDLSPPRRKQRAGSSDSDLSPPRRNQPPGKKAAHMYSGAKTGLVLTDIQQEQQELKKRDQEIAFEDEFQFAETIFRDKSGRKRNLKLERLEQRRKAEKDSERDELYAQWGKGLAQSRLQQQNVEDAIKEMQKPLARYIDDEDLDRMLREQEREGDPMADFIKKNKAKENKNKKVSPRYSGPAPPPNRFNIWPGYRWDGVDRSNGFEQKRFARLASKKAVEELAYKWSVEDM
nr:BUD13 homolog [Manis javanica]